MNRKLPVTTANMDYSLFTLLLDECEIISLNEIKRQRFTISDYNECATTDDFA